MAVIDMDRTTPQTTLSSRTLYNIPFPDQNSLRSGFRLIPGVLQDSGGGLHLFGGAETQTEFTFEGFQLNDPLTGRLDARMSLEAIQSVDVVASESGADNGRGAAGTMALHVRTRGRQIQILSHQPVSRRKPGRWSTCEKLDSPHQRGRALDQGQGLVFQRD